MQIEDIKDVKLLKSMAEAAKCHLKRIDYSNENKDKKTITKAEFEEIQNMENDLVRIQLRIAEIEIIKKMMQEVMENRKG